MTTQPKSNSQPSPVGDEEALRRAGNEQEGGQSLNTPLEDGQLRGVDADGNVNQGTRGGPKKPSAVPAPGREQGK